MKPRQPLKLGNIDKTYVHSGGYEKLSWHRFDPIIIKNFQNDFSKTLSERFFHMESRQTLGFGSLDKLYVLSGSCEALSGRQFWSYHFETLAIRFFRNFNRGFIPMKSRQTLKLGHVEQKL